jgi:hypothetical protein
MTDLATDAPKEAGELSGGDQRRGVRDTQLEPSVPGSQQGCLRGRWLPSCIAEMARIAAISARSKDDPAAAAIQHAIAHFALDFEREESVCVATGSEPDRFALLPPPAHVGLRGV